MRGGTSRKPAKGGNMDISTDSPVEKVHEAAVEQFRTLATTDHSMKEALSTTARTVVILRSKFTHNGRPDWAGRSQEYRDEIGKVYAEAGIATDSLDNSTQSKLRYHIGNVLREVAPKKDLEAIGLKAQSPREQQAARQRTTSPVSAVSAEAAELAVSAAQAVEMSDPVAILVNVRTLVHKAMSCPMPEDKTVILLAVSGIMTELEAFATIIKATTPELQPA